MYCNKEEELVSTRLDLIMFPVQNLFCTVFTRLDLIMFVEKCGNLAIPMLSHFLFVINYTRIIETINFILPLSHQKVSTLPKFKYI
jgi:hypothetical protein